MHFSCDDKTLLKKTAPIITKIIEDEGFVINEKKTHFHTPSNKKQITGITVIPTSIEDSFELKAPRKMKQTIRAEIYTCLVSGKYELKDHILGEIAYVNYVEKENKTTYLERIKTYIEKQVQKIQIFPELVEAYNKNKFFKDLKSITAIDINVETEEDFDSFKCLYQNRKFFLLKNELDDICKYENWPDRIIKSTRNIEEDSNIDFPF